MNTFLRRLFFGAGFALAFGAASAPALAFPPGTPIIRDHLITPNPPDTPIVRGRGAAVLPDGTPRDLLPGPTPIIVDRVKEDEGSGR